LGNICLKTGGKLLNSKGYILSPVFKRIRMLKRNSAAIIGWQVITRDYSDNVHPLKLDNGIWDLVSVTFPFHNIIPMPVRGYYKSAIHLIHISVRGKPAMIRVYNESEHISPSVALDNVVTGVFSPYLGTDYQSTGYIFPMYEDVIDMSELELGVVHKTTDGAKELRKKLLEVSKGKLADLFRQCLQTTDELEELGLRIIDDGYLGRQFCFGINGDDVQVLLDPYLLRFVLSDFAERNVEVMLEEMQDMIPELDFEYVESELEEIVAYDLPEWKPKSQEEVKRVEMILNFNPRYMEEEGNTGQRGRQYDMRDYYRILDRLMSLICFGYADEIPYEGDMRNFFDTIGRKFVEHYKQMPYDRMSLLQLSNYHDIDEKELHDPNAYRHAYNLLISDNNSKTIRPTLPPEDQFYYLSDIMKIEENWQLSAPPVFKKDEYELDIYNIPFVSLRINGIQFSSSDLIIFYNTQFYDLISSLSRAGESELSVP